MTKFLKKIGLLLLTLMLLMSVFDFVYTYTYANAVPRNQFQYISKMPPQSFDYVFLGSSRVADHVSAAEVRRLTGKSAINLGIEGASYHDNLLELQMLLARKVKINKVLLTIDHFYEFQESSTFGNAALLPFIRKPEVEKHLSGQLPDFTAAYYIPFYRYMNADHATGFREFVLSATGKKSKTDFSDGFMPRDGTAELEKLKLPGKLAKNNKYLDSIAELCTKNNIELVLFCAPYCSNAENLDYITKLKQRYPQMHDYSRSLPDSLFYDCAHLNRIGAMKFTKMLIKDCR